MKVAIAVRSTYERAATAAREAAARIRAGGHDVVDVALEDRVVADVRGAEVVLVFGGDGTMLRAARAFAPTGVPLLGVNLGHLGFLTITTVEDLDAAFADVVEGRSAIEERAMLDMRLVRRGGELARSLALNDVVVARAARVRSIRVAVRIDEEPLVAYWADGVITATATGSTAYGFSVGGPLILPSSRAITLVPIAPHLSFGNAFVFDPDQRIELELQDEPARISIDGQEEHDLRRGDRIQVRRADRVVRLVRTAHARPFLSLLRQKILKEPTT